MPHRAEARSAGRHRRDPRARHRAPLPFLDPARALLQHGKLPGELPRTALLTATLGAALIVGVAGGSAAAAATNQQTQPAPAKPGRPAAGLPLHDAAVAAPQSPGADPHVSAAPSALPTRRGGLPAVRRAQAGLLPTPTWQGSISAVPARQKTRPAARPKAGAAWVHPIPSGQVTSCFGPRWGRQHEGVDLAAPTGTPVVAAGAGVVVRAGEAGGYGIAVLIDHGNGYLTHYGHLSAVTVAAGQRVAAGQQIGAEGSTGHSTGPHLHLEVHEGHFQNPVEPLAWMRERGVDIPGCAAG